MHEVHALHATKHMRMYIFRTVVECSALATLYLVLSQRTYTLKCSVCCTQCVACVIHYSSSIVLLA